MDDIPPLKEPTAVVWPYQSPAACSGGVCGPLPIPANHRPQQNNQPVFGFPQPMPGPTVQGVVISPQRPLISRLRCFFSSGRRPFRCR